jgi:hypothetical protein
VTRVQLQHAFCDCPGLLHPFGLVERVRQIIADGHVLRKQPRGFLQAVNRGIHVAEFGKADPQHAVSFAVGRLGRYDTA